MKESSRKLKLKFCSCWLNRVYKHCARTYKINFQIGSMTLLAFNVKKSTGSCKLDRVGQFNPINAKAKEIQFSKGTSTTISRAKPYIYLLCYQCPVLPSLYFEKQYSI